MAELTAYSPPQADLETPLAAEDYDGIGRARYFLSSMAVGIANMVATPMLAESTVLVLLVFGAVIALSIYLVLQRLKNIGMSGWWAVGMLVPLLNFYVGVACVAFPPGYQSHKIMDTAGKILIGLFVGMLVLGIGAAIVLPMMLGG